MAALTARERVLNHLRLIAPDGATNADILRATGIKHHPAVYQITQQLVAQGLVRSERPGNEWTFFAIEGSTMRPVPPMQPGQPMPSVNSAPEPVATTPTLTAVTFEQLARSKMAQLFGTRFSVGSLPGVPKLFDCVSADGAIVGDAKYYTLVGGSGLPPAKFSVIAEHVWLLEKTAATTRFLVFGNDRQVPERWLKRYGNLAAAVRFYFLSDTGELEQLA